MATLQEQVEQSVQKYNENAEKVHKFINGTDSETIESTSGNKPTIAKIVKDTEDSIASKMTTINTKVEEVNSAKTSVEDSITELETSISEFETKYSGEVGTELGAIVTFPVESVPQGFLVCDGATIQKATYPDLVKFLTSSDSITSATLPDLRGVFVRGWDNARGIDSGRTLGSYQEDELKSHRHTVERGSIGSNSGSNGYETKSGENYTSYTGGSETRPKNVALVYAIKAFGTVVNKGELDLNGLAQDVNNLSQNVAINTVKGQETILWNGEAGSGSINLNQPYTDFRKLVFVGRAAGVQTRYQSIYYTSTMELETTMFGGMDFSQMYTMWFTSGTSINVGSAGGAALLKVIGIK